MRAKKNEVGASNRGPVVRNLKIQPKIRSSINSTKEVPEIKLCGSWLEKLGFHHGKRVAVTTMNELIIIRLQPE